DSDDEIAAVAITEKVEETLAAAAEENASTNPLPTNGVASESDVDLGILNHNGTHDTNDEAIDDNEITPN
ncbi:MAG TPA: hypothetical protein VEY71_03105, partial [Chitinophagales bacterium]|nr:hypothetical protein [Chitinophagales bacterium]